MRSWIEGGFKLLKRGGWQWQATRMTDPDRVERLWLVLAVATRYVLAVGGEADEAEFANATVQEPVSPSATAATGPPPAPTGPGKALPRRRGALERETATGKPRRRRTGRHQPECRGGGGPGDTSPSAAVAADRETPARVPRWRRTGRHQPERRGGGGPGDTSPSAAVAADRETPARVPRWRRTGRHQPECRGGGGPGRSSAWLACSDKAWRCC